MIPTKGYAARTPKSPLKPFSFKRRELRPHDVLIEILFCGICHSDIHQSRDEWDNSTFPMVPGHEITGRVARTGKGVTKFKAGDAVGVGCFVDSCRKCPNCKDGQEQFCNVHTAFTYNGTEMDEKTLTQGGYSEQIVVDENYVLRMPANLPLDAAAPLLCAGITTYSPLRRFKVGPRTRAGVIGLGGLGHMGVKLAAAMGAHVTVFSTSPEKEADVRRFGAKAFVMTKKAGVFAALENQFDFILDAVSAPHDMNGYLKLLKRDGTLAVVGVPEKDPVIEPFSLIMNNRTMAGSLIGGIAETQEMLDFCAGKKIAADIELIPMSQVNQAYTRTVRGDVKYRFVLDLKTL
jgi:uncharacterized zinc-type alcohol dehydrogenase-like protein